MTDAEKSLFTHFLNGSYLEWGSGGSTIEASHVVDHLVSIEHDLDWFTKTAASLGYASWIHPDRYDLYLVAPDLPRSFPYVKKEEFTSYINKVHELSYSYDTVLIDGRARIWCAEEVIPHLNKDAIVMVHDWDRAPYHEVLKWYKVYRVRGRMAALKLR